MREKNEGGTKPPSFSPDTVSRESKIEAVFLESYGRLLAYLAVRTGDFRQRKMP